MFVGVIHRVNGNRDSIHSVRFYTSLILVSATRHTCIYNPALRFNPVGKVKFASMDIFPGLLPYVFGNF
jgi:hypothetical protein